MSLTKKCKKCKKELPLSSYVKRASYTGHKCYECLKLDNKLYSRRVRRLVKKASGDCWWIEKWCLASIQYHGQKRK